jgi:four helix bundle protein
MDKRQNVQRSTLNVQRSTDQATPSASSARYDLEERLLQYAARVIRLVNKLPRTRAGNHVAKQLLKSGTSPLPNHGEAQAAESPQDFIHKLRICLKELRESLRWLRLIAAVPLLRKSDDLEEVQSLIKETNELIRIFFSSVRTTQRNRVHPDLPANDRQR